MACEYNRPSWLLASSEGEERGAGRLYSWARGIGNPFLLKLYFLQLVTTVTPDSSLVKTMKLQKRTVASDSGNAWKVRVPLSGTEKVAHQYESRLSVR